MTKVRGPRRGHRLETRWRWIFKSNRIGMLTRALQNAAVFDEHSALPYLL
jgi:hypothetical protein